eukprot:1317114-Amphidinium_carterae.2
MTPNYLDYDYLQYVTSVVYKYIMSTTMTLLMTTRLQRLLTVRPVTTLRTPTMVTTMNSLPINKGDRIDENNMSDCFVLITMHTRRALKQCFNVVRSG